MAFGRGKVILLGEHAVVYGRPALAAGIERGVTARAELADEDALSIDPWNVIAHPDAGSDEPLARALAALFETYESTRPRLRIAADVDLPGGAGLGCSAALAVAVAGAIDETTRTERTPLARAEQALAWERVFHGNPSGVDTAASALGGVLVYQKGEAPEAVRLRAPFRLVIADSGEPSSTKTMVDGVRAQRDRDPERIDKTFDAIASIVRNGRLALEAGDLGALGQLMDLDQALLSSLLVSTARLEELCGIARDAGAIGAKLTGAGGGGCIVALLPDGGTEAPVRAALEAAGASAFVAEVAP